MGGHRCWCPALIVGVDDLFGRLVAQCLMEASGVPPVHPRQGRKFDLGQGFPLPGVDELGLVQAVDGLGERIVVGIPTVPVDALIPRPVSVSLSTIETCWEPWSL